jgi:DNA recombination protein RmuC
MTPSALLVAFLAFLLGGALGAIVAASRRRGMAGVLDERLRHRDERVAALERDLAQRDETLRALAAERGDLLSRQAELKTLLEQERKSTAEKLEVVEKAQKQLADSFKALSGEALQANNQNFLALAKTHLEKFQEAARGDLDQRHLSIQELVRPVRESLEKFEGKIHELEKTRIGAYEGLRQHLETMSVTQDRLRTEASNLVKALRAPATRGRWGEIQLKRVVEMAGMLEHCDFTQQMTVQGDAGRLRPDLIVRLPSQKVIVVDAKAPLASYIDAIEAPTDELRALKMQDHARQIRDHINALSRKAYWEQFSPTPEFVILFLPGENFFGAALEHDPSLIEAGVEKRVLIATPTTLIALLQAVAYGWRQENLARDAGEISALGAELFKRLATMGEHWHKLGQQLGRSVESYNAATATLESRVLVTARKFKELHATRGDADLPEVLAIDKTILLPQASELKPGDVPPLPPA